MQRRYLIRGFAALMALFMFPMAGHGKAMAVRSPAEVIEIFHGALLTTMKQANALGISGRYQQLAGPVAESYDLAAMTRISCGGFWRRATDIEKQDMITAFSRISIGNYAVRFDGYSGQDFDVLGEKKGPRGTTLVEIRIGSAGDKSVELTYVMKQSEQGWRIIDVLLAGGVSELAVRRSEYRSILKSNGIRGLIGALNKKADGLVGSKTF